MRFPQAVFTVALLAAGVVCARAGGPAAELKQLEGRWLVAHRAYEPSPKMDKVAQLLTDLGPQVEIAGGKLSARDGGKKDYWFAVTFNPGTRPKAVDLKGPGPDGPVLLGIYGLEEDILTLAVGTGTVRPRNFRFGRDQILLILKRKPSPR